MNISKHEHSSPGNWRCSREHQQMKWWCYCNYKLEEFWSKFRFYKCIFEYKPLWCHWIWFWLISLQAPATKEQQRRPATLAVIFFTPIQEKSFFQFEFMDRKRKRHYYFLWKICSSCMTPIGDQYTSLVTSSHTLWPLHQVDGRHTKIGLILEKFAVQFWILAFFPVQDQQFFHLFLFVVFA